MRRLLLAFTAICIVSSSFAISKPGGPKPLTASEIYFPIGKHGEKISLMELSTIKVHDLENLTGKKMRFFERIGFKLSQKKLRSGIRADGTFSRKKMEKAFRGDGSSGFHLGGFALGFFLGLIGVLIAYLINDDMKSSRVKWAWIAWAITVVIVLIALLA
jgi:hypothetical protein